ncbi:MAG: hypothetical protein Q9180_000538 [Flavoplaca navasiana]
MARFILLQCNNADDRKVIRELTDSGSIWQALRLKDRDHLQVTNRMLHSHLNNTKNPEDPIDSTIADINSMARKLFECDAAIKLLTMREHRFQIYLRSLPEEYETIIDTLAAQENVNLGRAVKVLQEKKTCLQAEEAANWAKNKSGRPSMRQKSSELNLHSKSNTYQKDSSSDDDTPRCFLCNAPGHGVRNCPDIREFRSWLEAKSKSKWTDRDIKSKDKE